MKFVFDFGGVVFNWKPLVLLQQVLPHHAVDEASARDCATAIFQGFHPTSDWALFDQGGIEPEDLAHLLWAIESTPSRVGEAIRAALESMAENMDRAVWEADPEGRASYLREYDRLSAVADLWRRFIP